jgi:hypothetical protein
VTDEQVFLAIAVPILFTWSLAAILIGINFRGQRWFQMRLCLHTATPGGETMITAKLPSELRMDAPRTVSELSSGETGHTAFSDFLVRENGDCFLRGAAKLRNKSVNTIEVRRDDLGYHVIIPANIKYSPGQIPLIEERLPVASITIGPVE